MCPACGNGNPPFSSHSRVKEDKRKEDRTGRESRTEQKVSPQDLPIRPKVTSHYNFSL
jgi:hypothetical protein